MVAFIGQSEMEGYWVVKLILNRIKERGFTDLEDDNFFHTDEESQNLLGVKRGRKDLLRDLSDPHIIEDEKSEAALSPSLNPSHIPTPNFYYTVFFWETLIQVNFPGIYSGLVWFSKKIKWGLYALYV